MLLLFYVPVLLIILLICAGARGGSLTQVCATSFC
jgi:hypothetical protein